MRLWNKNPETPEGKYLVQRRDGTVPQWPFLVLGGADPAAVPALFEYADEAEVLGYDPEYVADVRALAQEFVDWQNTTGIGDADAPRHRKDDPAVIALMRQGNGS